MKQLLLAALAVGAMATGGAASAQDTVGSAPVLPQILGNIGLGNGSVALNPFPYLPPNSGIRPGGTVYKQENRDLVYMDPAGRQLPLDLGRTTDAYGRTIYLDRHGRTVYVDSNVAAAGALHSGVPVPRAVHREPMARRSDRDGVRNGRDRYPDDRRYR